MKHFSIPVTPLHRADRQIRVIEWLGAALLAAAFLLPVADAPWFSFWREWAAAIAALLVVLAAITRLRAARLPLRIAPASTVVVALGLALVCWLQFAVGLVPYHSDALLPSLYLAGFALCISVAGSMPAEEREKLADRLAAALLVAALVSVPLAVLQWIGWLRLDLGMRVAGGRPIAHMEQANLLCSLLIQGLFGAWRLAARGRIPAKLAMLMGALILATMVLTQSRVAWLVALAVLGVACWRRDVLALHKHRVALGVGLAALALGTVLLPLLDQQLGLLGAALSERVSEGRRPAAWALYIDAVTRQRWMGWGVLQNGVAQFEVAPSHPSLGYVFSSAHNVALDLMVWFGIPLGALAAAVLLRAVVRSLTRARDGAALASALAAAALTLHGMVELPLHYAYFLLPLGFWLGVTGSEDSSGPALHVSSQGRALLPTLSIGTATLLSLLGSEYIRSTDVRPVFALDKATMQPVLEAEVGPPDVMLLDQLRAFHAFAALPLAAGVGASELDAARIAMRRSPTSAAIKRYALLAALNGHEADAVDALRRVSKVESPGQFARSQYAWAVWRERWPNLPRGFEAANSD